MKNSPVVNKKTSVAKIPPAGIDGNITNYQYFFVSLIFLVLLVDILFQNGVTNAIIRRSWGINNFSYFPWWVQVFIFVLLFAIAIPSVNNSLRLFVQQLSTKEDGKNTKRLKKISQFIGISIGIALLFYLFKVKYDLLGDMDLRVSGSVEGKYISDEYFVMYFMHYLNIVLHGLFNVSPHQTFVIASIGAGFFFSFIGLLIADLLFKDTFSLVIFFLFYIAIGNLLVFCGYTEIYAIPAASAALYMYTALLYLKKKGNIILPFLCMVLAVMLHKEQISVLPSFIFIATRRFKFVQKLNIKIILILFLISIPAIYILNALFHIQYLNLLKPDSQSPHVPLLLSFSYFWEFFNSQYISSGALIFLFILLLVKALQGQIQLDDYSKFFLIATFFIYSIVFTMYKMRGSGDWDVCSFPAIYLSMFVAYTVLKQGKIIYSPKKLFYIVSTILLLNTFNSWAWIGINHREESLSKIKDMLFTDSDPIHFSKQWFPQELELARYYQEHGSKDSALKYYKLSYEKYSAANRGAVTNYASVLMMRKDTDTAVSVNEKAITLYPNFMDSYETLFLIYQKRKQYDKLYTLSELVGSLYDTNPTLVLGTTNSKNLLVLCTKFLYQNSLGKGDTAIYHDAVRRMQTFNH